MLSLNEDKVEIILSSSHTSDTDEKVCEDSNILADSSSNEVKAIENDEDDMIIRMKDETTRMESVREQRKTHRQDLDIMSFRNTMAKRSVVVDDVFSDSDNQSSSDSSSSSSLLSLSRKRQLQYKSKQSKLGKKQPSNLDSDSEVKESAQRQHRSKKQRKEKCEDPLLSTRDYQAEVKKDKYVFEAKKHMNLSSRQSLYLIKKSDSLLESFDVAAEEDNELQDKINAPTIQITPTNSATLDCSSFSSVHKKVKFSLRMLDGSRVWETLKSSQTFGEMIRQWETKLQKKIWLCLNGEALPTHATPASASINDTTELIIVTTRPQRIVKLKKFSSSSSSSSSRVNLQHQCKIHIVVNFGPNDAEKIRWFKDGRLVTLASNIAKRRNVAVVILSFDGNIIGDEDTPDSLEIEDGDQIDAKIITS